ncbi:FAD-linked oxidase [Burkholderia mayonis]|uniref:FAD-linked oxidase n=1 Tax=Burkholderia mayonis TaxID=1385591 RepID=A0A1B4FGR9_9BURK|nr:cholesterol oxidase substrate-binding domain-containing protein [Burkholderia mayonis]AOJ02837.1 FAD-linked oxidase [Burkholderia mayonis]KVE44273.1 FAD-linked oxidase [Burkholderia mayonis]
MKKTTGGNSPSHRRRAFLGDIARLAGAGVVAGWTPIYQIPAHARPSVPAPPNFPASIPLYKQAFQNWSGEIAVADLWTAAPATPADVVAIVGWAAANGYRVRPRGYMHNWSPLTVAAQDANVRAILVDTTKHLTSVSIDVSTKPARVTAQAGVSMDTLLATLERQGLGMTAVPAPGDITLGGALAIGAHGTALPASGETRPAGHTYGSLSNSVVSLTAVVHDASSGRYALRTFARTDPDIGPFLTHLGRAFIIEATLQVGANQRLQCESFVDIASSELFAPAGSPGRTVESFLQRSGRIEAIWFPFTDRPWLKVWTVRPNQPSGALAVDQPYNYPFSDSISKELSDLVTRILLNGEIQLAPLFGKTQYAITYLGLTNIFKPLTNLWGWSRSVLQYVRPTTLRVTANGYAVLTNRANAQRAINEFVEFYQQRVAAYRQTGSYPMNGPVEIRVTGVDSPDDVGPGAAAPSLSAIRPRPDHPDWNAAIWFDILTLPGTPDANRFYREIERWMLSNYSGGYATVRPEWSKGWGYTDAAAWSDDTMIGTTIPDLFRQGLSPADNWDAALRTLDRYDPQRVFSSPLLDRLAR